MSTFLKMLIKLDFVKKKKDNKVVLPINKKAVTNFTS